MAGGYGTRLFPLTQGISKQLLPVFDKPMIYYPLSILMLAGIKEILVITTSRDLRAFQRVLGDGSQWGLDLSYAEQPRARGLPDAFLVGRQFVGLDPVCLILGDNILYGTNLVERLREVARLRRGAVIFGYPVRDPERYGVVEFASDGRVLSLEEKPEIPRSNFAITGLYFFDNTVLDIAAALEPSERNELEIVDILRVYHRRAELRVEELGRGIAWLDAGTDKSLLQAAGFVQVVQERQGLMIACPEEIAYRMGYISWQECQSTLSAMPNNGYKAYLSKVLDQLPVSRLAANQLAHFP